MTAPAPAEVQAMCAKLHADFCAATGRAVPLRFYERAWWDILQSPEYGYDAEQLGRDVAHLVRYLKMGIAQGKRNAGCLKLQNFLMPDRFCEDVAESKVMMKPARPARPPQPVAAPAAAPEPVEDRRGQFAEELRKFRERGLR
jgi:hypothetical protein